MAAGAGGRPRKPTEQKIREGTARADRNNPNEPTYPVSVPEKPPNVAANPEASAHWDDTLAEMLLTRTVSRVFLSALATKCMSWADMVRLDLDPASSFADRVKARIQARRAELRPVQGAWGKTPVV
jgi:hypothetical protein